MRRIAATLVAATTLPLLSGCIAAAVPVAAAGALGGKQIFKSDGGSHSDNVVRTDDGRVLVPVEGATQLPAPDGSPASTTPKSARLTEVPPTMQYLYGSGEAAALSVQAYRAMADYVTAKASDRAVGHKVESVVLADNATLGFPVYEPCAEKPLAVVLDIDETSVQNLGFESYQAETGAPYTSEAWDAWERGGGDAVAPVPGVADALKAARQAGVVVVFNSNRLAENAAATEKMLDDAGLGPAVHGISLYLKGDAGGEGGKDARRREISKNFCVVAMVGDQLGDFSDLYDRPGITASRRRQQVLSTLGKAPWGDGWFMLPNPVYGSALKGGLDDVFPADKRWTYPSKEN